MRAGLGTAACGLGSGLGCAGPAQAASASPPHPDQGAAALPAYIPKPLSFDPTKLDGLSEKLIRSHHENNYTGAVTKLNGVRQQLAEVTNETPGYLLHGLAQGELAFKHSVVLHELYFGQLGGDGKIEGATAKLLSESFGGASAWEERFRAHAKSLGGGSGWAIVEYDLHEKAPRMYAANDHTQGLSSGIPLLVLDMYEHAYHIDFGAAAAKYIEAFLANLDWQEIDRRSDSALRVAATLG
jgi:superoxide dismutase, Fe-Mn family